MHEDELLLPLQARVSLLAGRPQHHPDLDLLPGLRDDPQSGRVLALVRPLLPHPLEQHPIDDVVEDPDQPVLSGRFRCPVRVNW
jgi:hypothetical protein